jgi:beta-galactosidase
VLTAVRNNVGSLYDDVTQIRATVVDKAGVRVPRASNLMRFTVTGQGDVVAVDNGDIASHESFQGTLRSAHDGMAVAYVRASANARRLRVTVSAIGLKSGIMGLWLADQ